MTGQLKALAMVVALATATACGDASSPTEVLTPPEATAQAAKPSSSLTFSSTRSYDTRQSQTATGTIGAINFTGSVTTSNPCFDVTASHGQQQNTITLTVTAAYNGNICTQVITHHNYQGAVSGLASGTYTFNVVHNVGGTTTTAYSGSVLVL
ncbi:MAG TPA: hypothetical protein VHG91_07530 [Longimicrobium sp.]|nr:hypothetical protein [Longimicrobium sp.]